MRLTRRGWNNVIVFGVLTLFVLFYIVPHVLKGKSDLPTQLILPHQQYLEYRFPAAKLTNVAGVWQFMPSRSLPVDPVMQAWQRLQLPSALPDAPLAAVVCQVELVVSAQAENLRVQLSTGTDGDYLQVGNAWYRLSDLLLNQLCPVSLRQ